MLQQVLFQGIYPLLLTIMTKMGFTNKLNEVTDIVEYSSIFMENLSTVTDKI